MRDVIWTIIIIWVVYKIIGIFRSSSAKKTVIFNKYETHNHTTQQKPEGSVTVEKNAKDDKSPKANSTDGEYVDFEEIK
jgi:hypothetical protein